MSTYEEHELRDVVDYFNAAFPDLADYSQFATKRVADAWPTGWGPADWRLAIDGLRHVSHGWSDRVKETMTLNTLCSNPTKYRMVGQQRLAARTAAKPEFYSSNVFSPDRVVLTSIENAFLWRCIQEQLGGLPGGTQVTPPELAAPHVERIREILPRMYETREKAVAALRWLDEHDRNAILGGLYESPQS